MAKGVAEEYTSSLADLTVNSKPLINMLTMLAEDYIEHAPTIVRAIEAHLQKVPGEIKLPVLYLIDSIVKNVGKDYVGLFTQNIVSTFCTVFEQVDEKIRAQMYKLRQTWNEVFLPKKLYALDARVKSIDPAWPITATPPHGALTRIHVNPKFLNTVPPPLNTVFPPESTTIADGSMREELLRKQKELLELQKRKVELELLQTKAILEEQQKKLENQTAGFKSDLTNVSVSTEKVKSTVQEKPEIFAVPKTKVYSDANHERAVAVENSRVRDPRLRIKKINNKRPNGPGFPTPVEKTKSNKANVFGEDGSSKYSEENHNSVNNDFNGVKRTERRSERKHKKYKEHKSRPKPDEHSITESSHSKVISSDIVKHKELPPTLVNPSGLCYVPEKISIISNTSENKSEEADKTSIKSSPSKSRVRSKTKEKEKHKKKTDVASIPQSKVEDIISKVHSLESKSPIKENDNKLHGDFEHKIDLTMDVEVKTQHPPEEHKINEFVTLPPKEEPVIQTSTSTTVECQIGIPSISNITKDVPMEPIGDTDLRLLPQSKTESEHSPEKKSKAELALFGQKDVDLRTFPPPNPPNPPTPPPPPVISNSIDSDVDNSGNWAIIKRCSTDSISPNKSPKKMRSSSSSSRISFFNKVEDDLEDKISEQESEGRSHSYCYIMNQAEEQLKNGSITFTQYNQILKGVMTMNEESKLQEAIMKDEMEMDESSNDAILPSGTADLDKETPYNHEVDEDFKLAPTGSEMKSETESSLEKHRASSEGMGSSFSEHGNDVGTRKRSHYKEQFHRTKEQRHSRYYNQDPFFMNNNKAWMMRPPPPNFVHRPPRKDMMYNSRWGYQSFNRAPFDSKPINFGQPSRMRTPRHHPEMSLPAADPNVLEMIQNDPMTYVNVGGMSKEIRFYGENAIIMMDWDDPHDLMFQPGSRRVFIDGVDILTLQFNSQYREITLTDGVRIRIRLGAPTRELFIDGRFYDVKFGGPPVEINLGGRTHLIQLEGPLPFLKIGPTKRTDLVAGKVNLIVDGKIDNMFPVYLDAKPQRFEIGNVPFIIRFVEALQTVVINGQPFKMQFGGLPVPIFFRGEKHFLRLTSLPPGIVPGYVTILNMEGGRLPTPPPPRTPPPPQINGFETPVPPPPGFIKQNIPGEMQGLVRPIMPVPYFNVDYQLYNTTPNMDQPVDVLTSLMTPPTVPNFSQVPSQNYVVETSQENPPPSTAVPVSGSTTSTSVVASTPNINVSELYKKLAAIGVVPPLKEKECAENRLAVKPVDFSKPETLKQRQLGLINRLYSGIQCSSCGVRFAPEQTVKHSQHLDWHFRQNRRERHSSKIALSRKWNYDVSDWIQYQEIEDIEDRAQSWFEMQDKKSDANEKEEKDEPTVPAKGFGENPCCTVCRDKFDQFFNEEKEEWQLKHAICVEEKLYHPLCYKDEQESEGKNVGEMLMNIQEELHSIETIVIDDSVANGSSEDERKVDGEDSTGDNVKEEIGKTENSSAEQSQMDVDDISVNVDDEESSVPLSHFNGTPACAVCSEKFEEFLDEDKKESYLKPAVFLHEKLYHPQCLKKYQEENSQTGHDLNEQEETTGSIETILVDDSVTTSNEGIVEEIDLDANMDTENSVQEPTEKSETSEMNNKLEKHSDSDDDILEIEVLKPNIESYEILDDDDEEAINNQLIDHENFDNSKDRTTEMDTSETEVEEPETSIVIKTEKVDLSNIIQNPSHITETISLDGNSEFSAPKIVLPKKIKINISSIVQKNSCDENSSEQQSNNITSNTRIDDTAITFNNLEPLPPGEELYPAHLKPKLLGKRLAEMSPVSRGKELSGLCSIM